MFFPVFIFYKHLSNRKFLKFYKSENILNQHIRRKKRYTKNGFASISIIVKLYILRVLKLDLKIRFKLSLLTRIIFADNVITETHGKLKK